MYRNIWLSLALITGLAGCKSQDKRTGTVGITYAFPDVLPVDSANKMLGSYLNSVGASVNDTAVNSITFDARLLRKYLDSLPLSANITQVKIMFAHKLSYINEGHVNHNAGFKTDALTLIIAGFNANGEYVFLPERTVLDHGVSCPHRCPLGDAANPLIPVISARP